MRTRSVLPLLLLMLTLLAGCARSVAVVSDPAAAASATLVVANHTDWHVMIEAQPAEEPSGTLTLGQVEPGGTAAYANVPVGRALTLRAVVSGSTRTLTGPTRTFEPGERWEWLVRPGAGWSAP